MGEEIDGIRDPEKNKSQTINYGLTHLIFEQKKRVKQSSKTEKDMRQDRIMTPPCSPKSLNQRDLNSSPIGK